MSLKGYGSKNLRKQEASDAITGQFPCNFARSPEKIF